MILPLADERDVRTQIRWGLADFRHRFGRQSVNRQGFARLRAWQSPRRQSL